MRWRKYILCVGAGILFFLAAEFTDTQSSFVENGVLKRNSCGKGDAVYEFYVKGLDEEEIAASVSVPEQRLSKEQFEACIPAAMELLCARIPGENPSLQEVRSDLNLEDEIPEYGIQVSWQSENPEIVSSLGTVNHEAVLESGVTVLLYAVLTNGNQEETVELPVTVYPPLKSREERFLEMLEQLAAQNMEEETVVLPDVFEGQGLSYRSPGHTQNLLLVFLGVVAAFCMYLKEKSDAQEARRRWENSLMADYPDLVSGFLILTGAGYPAKAAWKKLADDFTKSGKDGMRPLAEEMKITVNQMETGTPEVRAYAAFGKRCGIRCYVKFASLLESSVSTGGKNLRKQLETEMEEAFKQRTDMARRKGEETSSRLLIPMFGMLGVVLVMVVAPAFLSLS